MNRSFAHIREFCLCIAVLSLIVGRHVTLITLALKFSIVWAVAGKAISPLNFLPRKSSQTWGSARYSCRVVCVSAAAGTTKQMSGKAEPTKKRKAADGGKAEKKKKADIDEAGPSGTSDEPARKGKLESPVNPQRIRELKGGPVSKGPVIYW